MKTKEELKWSLCDRIQARIEELGLTQVEVANLTGHPQGLISDIKRHRTDYGPDSLISILARLGEEVEIDIVVVKKTKGLPRLAQSA